MALLTCWDCKWLRRTRSMDGSWTFSCLLSSEKGIRFEAMVTLDQKACGSWVQRD
jgi:hypothetical protein